jgi:hypothetical protein
VLLAQRVRPRVAIFKAPLLKVIQAHPFGLVHLQAPFDEILHSFRDCDTRLELDGYFGHFVDQLGFRFALPGSFSKEEFIDHDANRPYVVFDGIDVFLEGLGGHVEWTANVVLFLL